MKKAISLLLALVMCLSLCACGGKSPIVGTWQTHIAGTTYTYVFKSDNTYTFTLEGAFNTEDHGKYALNEDNGTIIFSKDTGDITHTVQLRDCCIILNEVKYGKVYTENEKCEVLDTVLGKWENQNWNMSIEFHKDGTCTFMSNGETDTGLLYIYDPVEETIHIPGASLTFEFKKTETGTDIYAETGLWFSR